MTFHIITWAPQVFHIPLCRVSTSYSLNMSVEESRATYVGYSGSWASSNLLAGFDTVSRAHSSSEHCCRKYALSTERKLICCPDVNKCASKNGPLHIRQWVMPLDFTRKLLEMTYKDFHVLFFFLKLSMVTET